MAEVRRWLIGRQAFAGLKVNPVGERLTPVPSHFVKAPRWGSRTFIGYQILLRVIALIERRTKADRLIDAQTFHAAKDDIERLR